MRVGPQPAARGSRLCFEGAKRPIMGVLSDPPGPAEAYQLTIDVPAIREHHFCESTATAIRAVVADDHDLSHDQLAQRLLGLVAERLALLRGIDPSKPNDDLASLVESVQYIPVADRDHACSVGRGLRRPRTE